MKEYFGAVSGYGADFYYLYTYEYDEAGNLIKENCFSYYFEDNGSVESWIEYIY